MAVRSELALVEEEEEEEQQEVYDGPTHHPYAPSDELFEISTTVDPSYIISLVRKLVPSVSGCLSSLGVDTSTAPNQGSNTDNTGENVTSPLRDEAFITSNKKSDSMDIVTDSAEFSHQRGENEDLCKRLRSGVTVGEEAWEEYGCVLWDLAASKTHAELMVQNLILEVLLANLMISQFARVSEICIGIIGNLACHEVPMKHIVSTNGLIELIVDQLFLDDPQCLCETFRLLTMGLRSNECVTWSEALQSEPILCRFLWVAENTMNLQLIEKSIGLILAICESQPKVVDALFPPLMKLGLASLLISLLSFEMSKLMSERIPERYSVLDVILRVIEALSVMDGYSQDICSNKELFLIVCDLVKLPDKVEVANSCVTAAVLIANILSDIADQSSDISQDFSFLQGLLDIFPFASDDLEARSAVWSIVARLLVRVQENDMSLTSLYHYVSVIVSKTDMIEDDLLHQQLGYSSYEHESLAPSGAKLAARTTSLKRIISILNHWTALKENADVNNVMGEPLVNDVDINRLLECCHKHSK